MKNRKIRIITFFISLVLIISSIPKIEAKASSFTWSSGSAIINPGDGYQFSENGTNGFKNNKVPEPLLDKLQKIYNGDLPIYLDNQGKTRVDSKLGSTQFPDKEETNSDNRYVPYIKENGSIGYYEGTSCCIYAAGAYTALFGESENPWFANHLGPNTETVFSGKKIDYDTAVAKGIRTGAIMKYKTGTYWDEDKQKYLPKYHVVIVLEYNTNGMVFLNANLRTTNVNSGTVSIQYRDWSVFGKYNNITILQPKAEYYEQLYPACDHEWAGGVCKKCYAIDYNVIEETTLPGNKVVKVNVDNAYVNKVPVDIGDTKKVPKNQVLHVKSKIKNGYGNYWYKVSYLDSVWYIWDGRTTKTIEDAPSLLTIDANGIYSVEQGSKLQLTGIISSNYFLTAKGYLDNDRSNTVAYQSKTLSISLADTRPNGFSAIDTSKLSTGWHVLHIVAYDESNAKLTRDISFLVTAATRVAAPSISPVREENGGKYVTITQNETGATLKYTQNGITKSSENNLPVEIHYNNEGRCNVSAYSIKNGVSSSVESKSFDVYRVGSPNITYTNNSRGASVTINSSTSGAQIYYSLDGGQFYNIYNGTFQVEENTTVYAKASRIGYIDSTVTNTPVRVIAPTSPIVSVNNPTNHIAMEDNAVVSWSSDGLASYYRVEVYKDGNLVKETENLYTAQFTMALNEAGTYSFKVKAVNPFGETYSANSVSITAHAPNTVSFVNYDGEVLGSYTVKYGYDSEKPAGVPTRRGYTFTGWDKSFYNVKSDITITAMYKINVYKINYYDQNDKYLTYETVEFGQSINSEKGESFLNLGVGYGFKGWHIRKASDDSYRDVNSVDSNMDLVAVTGWEDKEYPVIVTDLAAVRHLDKFTNVSTGYDITFKISSIDGQDTKAKIVASAYSADNKMVATQILLINSVSATQEEEQHMFLSDDENENVLAARIEINVLSLEGNDRTGGTIAEAVSCIPSLEDDNSAWSSWMDQLPEGVTTATQTKTVYRSRENTKDYSNNDTGIAPEGYTLESSSSYQDPNWIGPFDYYIAPSATRAVDSRTVVASYKQQYRYYRCVCNKNRNHGWYGGVGSCATYMHYPASGSCTGRIVDSDIEYLWSDIPYSTAMGWYNATGDGNVKKYPIDGVWWYYWVTRTTNQGTRTVADTYKTQYWYKDTHYNYTYYRWLNGNWSDWGDKELTAKNDGSFDVESKTVYRYITRDMTTTSENEAYSISFDNASVSASDDTPATLMIYKSLNTDPTESQLEYVKQMTIGDLDGYTLKTKEPVSESTGDYVVAIAVKGYDGLINIDRIEAPKQKYSVVFQTESGDVISEQEITEGESAEIPEAPEKEGFLFTGWDKATTNVTYSMVVLPKYVPIPYSVVYVDYLNKTCEIKTHNGGDLLTVPEDVPFCDGYSFNGWIGADEGTIVTGNMVITADWTPNTYSVTFYDADENVLETQYIDYGESAVLPELSLDDDRIFVGWKTDVEWWNVKSDLDVYPIMIYKESASAPESNVPTEYYSDFASIELDAEEGATIYYTLDGSEPGLGYIAPAEYDEEGTPLGETFIYEGPIELEDSAYIRAIAAEEGKNVSEELNITFTFVGDDTLYNEPEWNEIGTYNVIVEPGMEIEVNVNLESNPGILGYLFCIECDRGVFCVPCDEEGNYIVELGESFAEGSPLCCDYGDSGWQFLWYTEESSMKAGNIFSVSLMVADDAEKGTYPISVYYSPMNTVTEENIDVVDSNIDVMINADNGFLVGDVTGDGYVGTQDVLRIARHVAGISKLSKNAQIIGDVNQDGKLTLADAVRLARYILGMASLG